MIVLRPRYKRESIVEMLTLVTAKPLQDLQEAVEAQRTVHYLCRLMIRLPQVATPSTTITSMDLSLFSDRRLPPLLICAIGPKSCQNPERGAT